MSKDREKVLRLLAYLETLEAKANALNNVKFFRLSFGGFPAQSRYVDKARECVADELDAEISEIKAELIALGVRVGA